MFVYLVRHGYPSGRKKGQQKCVGRMKDLIFYSAQQKQDLSSDKADLAVGMDMILKEGDTVRDTVGVEDTVGERDTVGAIRYVQSISMLRRSGTQTTGISSFICNDLTSSVMGERGQDSR